MSYISSKVYRQIFLLKKVKVKKFWINKLYSNSTTIPLIFRNKTFKIYNGRIWNQKYINKWMVGYKAGMFVWTRRLAIYKSKQKIKKKK